MKKHIAIVLELDTDNENFNSSKHFIKEDIRRALTLHTTNWYKILAIVSTGKDE